MAERSTAVPPTSDLPVGAVDNDRPRRVRAAAALIAVVAVAASAAAAADPLGQNWHRCPAGAGGAFNLRVHRLTCAYAASVTEDGLYPNARRTLAGDFTCQRRQDAHRLWSYTCQRAQRRQALSFETY